MWQCCVLILWPWKAERAIKMLCVYYVPAHERSIVMWAEDRDVPLCPFCARSFNLARRRHHCRLCGGIMCDQCSQFITFDYASMGFDLNVGVLMSDFYYHINNWLWNTNENFCMPEDGVRLLLFKPGYYQRLNWRLHGLYMELSFLSVPLINLYFCLHVTTAGPIQSWIISLYSTWKHYFQFIADQ